MLSGAKMVFRRARSSDLAIRVKTEDELGMNKTVLQALNNPRNLYFWWGEHEKVLAIGAADKVTDMSVPVPDFFYNTRNGSRLSNWKLVRVVKKLAGWADESVHLLVGKFVPELNLIVFHTSGEDKALLSPHRGNGQH